MRGEAKTTLASSGLIIGVAAVGLTRAIFHLRAIRANLVATTSAARTVAELTETVPDRLTSVNASLQPVRDFCETV